MAKSTATDVPEWMTVDVICEGDEPILLDPMSRDQLMAIHTKTTRPASKERPVEDVAAEKLEVLRDTDGRLGIPRYWLFAALKLAGRMVKTGNGVTKISTADSTLLRSFMRFDGSCLTVTGEGDKFVPFSHHSAWQTDVRKGSSNATAGKSVAVAIIRPRIDQWGFRVRIRVHQSINAERVRDCFAIAGSVKGLGSFRPGKGGEFGTFVVSSWVPYTKGLVVPAFELAPAGVDLEAAVSNGKVPAGVGA